MERPLPFREAGALSRTLKGGAVHGRRRDDLGRLLFPN
ncbi:hypothetical protein B8V81_2719 [Paenibacillus pasadenensis]|uniref:Uncharacterized protein n=1 Tax=Paenibacillus pasadenensis TaxID=217090 RepID=A0A2N5N1S5_9BACL|nr:hypothetical protein B8V81_2719 [Paenibacillus pasadenensis]